MTRGPAKSFDRDAVLEKAMELFWVHGYEGTGLAELTTHMGIGRQSLYDTFGDKRSLFLEALRHYFATQVGPVVATIRKPGSALANLESAFEMWERMGPRETGGGKFHGCMVGNSLAELAAHDEEIAEILRVHIAKLEDALVENFKRGQEAGEISADVDPRDMARTLISGVQGLALLARVTPDPAMFRSVVRTTFRMLGAR